MQANNPQAAERDMSEREKLHAGVVAELRRGLTDPLTADAVIRLVVEACCGSLLGVANVAAPQTKHAAHRLGLLTAVLHLRDTFTLPTPKENERG